MRKTSNRPGVAITCVAFFFAFGACDKDTRTGDRDQTPAELPDSVEQTHAPMPAVQPSANPDPASDVSETELALFAKIEARRASIQQQQLADEAKNGATEAELKDTRTRLQQQLTQALSESQLDEKRYGEIRRLLQRNPVLRERAGRRIEPNLRDL